MVKFKDFSRPLSVFEVLFKTNLIFKDFFKPVRTLVDLEDSGTSEAENDLISESSDHLGAQWLSGSRPRGRGFEPRRRHCVMSLSKNINPSLVQVQPRKTRPYITERLLMGHKESNQTKSDHLTQR